MPGGRRLARGQASEHGTFWPLGPQRAKPIERHGYTNDMVMAKGENFSSLVERLLFEYLGRPDELLE
mgnify:CR=1 FL=1